MPQFTRLAQIGLALLLSGLMLSACGAPQPTVTATISASVTPHRVTETPRLNITSTPKSWPTAKPRPTLLPTLDPVGVSKQISDSIRMEAGVGVNRLTMQRVTGWSYGWRSPGYCTDGPYRWLDSDHLLLYSVTGEVEGMGVSEYAMPVVLNLNDGLTWLPVFNGPALGCDPLLWSDYLQLLIAVNERETTLYTSSGAIYRLYDVGNGLYHRAYLSPSGRKALIGSTWMNLETGQTVNTDHIWGASGYDPAWSTDETRLFECCFHYADARSGETKTLRLGKLSQAGRGIGPGDPRVSSHWVLSDTRVIVDYQFMEGEQIGVVPLIDPVAGSYEDIRTWAGIAKIFSCIGTAQGDGEHAQLFCNKGGAYLVDLRSFISTTLPVSTSPTARTATMSIDNQQWAWLSFEGQALNVENLSTQSTLQLTLTQPATQLVWHPNNISLVAVSTDGSLWWIADPTVNQVEQLTPPLPEVRDVKWSPNGDKLAFVSGVDVYIVTVNPP